MYVADGVIALAALAVCALFAAHVWDWDDSRIRALFMEVEDDGRK